MTTLTTLREAVAALRDAFDKGAPATAPFNEVLRLGRTASAEERNHAVEALLAREGAVHPEISGHLCVASGALVEMGASTQLGLDTILDDLAEGATVLAAAPLDHVDLDGGEPPPKTLERDQRRWAAGFHRHVVGAMARLARDVAARKRARAHPRLGAAVAALGEQVAANHVQYLVEIMNMLDDEPLLVVDLPAGRAVRSRAYGGRSGFHLMTVLDGKDPFALVERGHTFVEADHGYFTWPAIEETTRGFEATGAGHLLWGEMRAVALPLFEGVRTVLRGRKLLASRMWEVALVAPIHDALRESVVVEEELSTGDALPLLRRMAAAVHES